MSWNEPKQLHNPWMKSLSDQMSGLPLPFLRGERLLVMTDYSFDNRDSGFDAIGLLITGQTLGRWDALRSEVRERLLPDGRSMSWKKLNSDWRRESAFFPFLVAADQIDGLAVVVAFQRHPDVTNKGLQRFQESLKLSAAWEPHAFEQLFSIAYCLVTFIAGLSRPGQQIYWMSDRDHIFANDVFEGDTIKVVSLLLRLHSPHRLGAFVYGTPAIARTDFVEDLLAIPDLMCGATCEIATSLKQKYTDFPQVYSELPPLSRRSEEFLKWYANDHCLLKRYICTFEARRGKAPSLAIMHPGLLGRGPIQQASRKLVPRGWPQIIRG